jgi:hypothetical protein
VHPPSSKWRHSGAGNLLGLRWQDVDCAPKTICASARTASTRSAGRNRRPANARFIPAQIAAGVTVDGIRSGGKDGGLQSPGKVVQERMGRDRQHGIDTGICARPDDGEELSAAAAHRFVVWVGRASTQDAGYLMQYQRLTSGRN